MQVKEKTLVVGVDIARHTHVARAQDYRGNQYGKAINFSNTLLGFKQFLHWIREVSQEQDKSEAIVGIEPTGNYWLALEQFLKAQENIELVIVNPAHVKKSKTLGNNSPTKIDKKGARVIAQLVKDGRYSIPHMPEGVYGELKVAITHQERLNKDQIRIKTKIQHWIDKYFPSFL